MIDHREDYKVNLAGIDMVLESILEMKTALIVPGITTPHRFGEQTAVDTNAGLDKQHETGEEQTAVDTKYIRISEYLAVRIKQSENSLKENWTGTVKHKNTTEET